MLCNHVYIFIDILFSVSNTNVSLDLIERDAVAHITALTTLLCTDFSTDQAANEKKMSISIYLKQFVSTLTVDADNQLKKMQALKKTKDSTRL